MPVVFLSHSSMDKFFARKLAEKLKSHGLQVWIDEAEPRVRDTVIDRIAAAVTESVTVLAVLSNTSVKSKWIRQELKQAMDQEIGGRRVDVATAVIDKCPVPDYLADTPSADFSDPDDFNGPLSKLLHVLGAARVAAAIVAEPRAPESNGSRPREPDANGVRPRVYPTAPTLEAFENIRIVGVDRSRLFRPDPGRRLYHVYFELSDRPPPEWCQMFEAERELPRHAMWRRAWVEGKYVVVHCEPEEVEAHHLADLKEDVATSNQKYREHLKQEADARVLAAARGRTEEEVVLRMLGNLRFD
jgi:TIR domain